MELAPASPAPKAARDGRLRVVLVRTGDRITIDATKNEIKVDLSDVELKMRREQWIMPAFKATRGTLGKYIRVVQDAALGCVTDE